MCCSWSPHRYVILTLLSHIEPLKSRLAGHRDTNAHTRTRVPWSACSRQLTSRPMHGFTTQSDCVIQRTKPLSTASH